MYSGTAVSPSTFQGYMHTKPGESYAGDTAGALAWLLAAKDGQVVEVSESSQNGIINTIYRKVDGRWGCVFEHDTQWLTDAERRDYRPSALAVANTLALAPSKTFLNAWEEVNSSIY